MKTAHSSTSGCSLVLALSFAVAGCGASARFHSKTGRRYRAVTTHAVRCDEAEARLVAAAGGQVIGTISAKALTVGSTSDDVADKAARVAAKNGGTHVVLTDKGVEWLTVQTPAQSATQCTRIGDTLDCRSVYTPASSSTYAKPRATFVVLRLSETEWSRLPEPLRPVDGS